MNLVPSDDPILQRACEPVVEVTDDIVRLSSEMLEFMYESKGIGLAAPQVGHSLRMFTIDCSGGNTPMVCMNPEIIWTRGSVEIEEGCLSFPGQKQMVERHAEIKARFLGLDGKLHEGTLTGIWAICFQHELDHLDGVTMFERAGFQRAGAAQASSTP